MFAIFMECSLIIKFLLCYTLTTALFNTSSVDYSEGRTAIYGKRYNTGVTFATKADAEKAIARAFDSSTSFTCDVYRLIYCVQEGSRITLTHATITQIAPKIFLCCKHTAANLRNTLKEKDRDTSIYLQQSDKLILKATNQVIVTNPEADIALMKLEFDDSETVKSDFLSIAKPIDSLDANGYVISYSDVSVINSEDVLTTSKALSIHPFQYTKTSKNKSVLKSTMNGRIAENIISKMERAFSMVEEDPSTINKDALKAITREISIEFPATYAKTSLRFMSILHEGCSGSPLIIKQDGLFTIFGIHTNGGFCPRFFEKTRQSDIPKKEIYYINNFVDLTLYNQWIIDTIRYMT